MTSFKVLVLFASVLLFIPAKSHKILDLLGKSAFEHLHNEYLKASGDSAPTNILEAWIEQRLDHFDDKENRTWMMRYFEKLDYWKEGGPIYIYIGGEGEATDRVLNVGPINGLAKETDGAVYASEHRFYGKSVPLSDFSTENLKFLSSRQALADLAHLIKNVSKPGSKVVVVGGSYAGNLAVWMRALYPDIVDAAISSSAPVLAKKDFYEYMEAVADDYHKFGNPACVEKISKIFGHFAQLFKTNEGIEQLKKENNICNNTNMHESLNQQWFMRGLIFEFQENSQIRDPATIKRHCEKLSELPSYFGKDSHKLSATPVHLGKNICISYDFADSLKQLLQDVRYKPWVYQTCTEFGYFSTLSSKKQPFTNNLQVNMFIETCKYLFGSNFNEKNVDNGIENTNRFYGGLKPNVTNVVFINGEMDPWSRLGITHDLSADAPSKVIKNASHCRDLYPESDDDEPELKEVRKFVKSTVKKWIGS